MASDSRPSSSSPANKSNLPPRTEKPLASPSRGPTEAITREEKSGEPVDNVDAGGDDEEEDDEDDEPKLKYTRLTKSLGGVYRNGDAVSCTWVGGDKMVRYCFVDAGV